MAFTPQDIALLLQAFDFAAAKHQHQRRKNEWASPYINHLIGTAEVLWNIGKIYDIPTIVAAILHDTLEDTDTSPDELQDVFGEHICSIVQEVSDDKTLPKETRKELQIVNAGKSSLEARHIKLADKICNVLDIADAPPSGWTLERRKEYVNWAKKVIDALRGTHVGLEARFDQVCAQVTHTLDQEEQAAVTP